MIPGAKIEQRDPPLPPDQILPTMYDLPSEDPEEPGLPDEFHDLQPQLLSATLQLSTYAADNRFTGTDLNLYYDIRQPLWYKRPDWFLVLGVPRLYQGQDLRLSYVLWQEGVSPFVVVELISPGTEAEDLGQVKPSANQPPTKWQVYEQILRVPYYIVYNRYSNQLQAFGLKEGTYQPLELTHQKLWIPQLNLGLGLWQGTYQGISRHWLRWYNPRNWISTEAEQERQRAEQAEAKLLRSQQQQQRLIEQLRARGIDPDELLS
ncbi:MAG: Uma2 family endonuclease [Leptolyngbyaceae cyanobacterium SM1_1_3]|nr:Uma2 family endonuclease [Leptolyngbyaceae cyanobacterium SM1_1_3]NJM85458.1 Uma2 family endonuclease [Leptolyngbyaceae cyanobacterium RM2_2_21]NJN02610.1 Uma2 family endonuclease [Leptolyngbyaceae cyanobacterium RM1_1_2]NJO10824.1 Uma2 family endonuclease [Leptolyngbyaceae cyanobacterium SL_1_1]